MNLPSIHPFTTQSISLAIARALAVTKQGLAGRPEEAGRAALLEAIRQIGLLQLDTIHVVARSQYLVLLSRLGLYDPADLDALLYPERALFEGWAHAACLIPSEDYPYFAPVIAERRARPNGWRARLGGPEAEAILDRVLARIRENGPVRAADFEDPRPSAGAWWDWKPAKIALEILFDEGRLMIDRRVNFHRYYELAERVLPASAESPALTLADWQRWATRRSIACLGIAAAGHIADYYRLRKPAARTALAGLLAEGSVVPLAVEGRAEPWYVCAEDLALVQALASGSLRPQRTAFLSPFDNLMWNRQRLADLFGFAYQLELYASTAKGRRYGYYVMGILHDGRLIGRLDPKADRRTGTLILHALSLEPSIPLDDALLAGLRAALAEFAAFHRCRAVIVERGEPALLAELLRSPAAENGVVPV